MILKEINNQNNPNIYRLADNIPMRFIRKTHSELFKKFLKENGYGELKNIISSVKISPDADTIRT